MCRALLLSLSAVSMSLVCEEDGTEVDSDDFLMTLPDNTMLMALQPGETWRPQPVRTEKRKVAPLSRGFRGSVSDPPGFGRAQISRPRQAPHWEGYRSRHLRPLPNKPKGYFRLAECEGYISRPLFRERWLSVSGTKESPQVGKSITSKIGKVLLNGSWFCLRREALRVASTLLQAAGHLLITSASVIRRIIEGTELWSSQRAEYTTSWNWVPADPLRGPLGLPVSANVWLCPHIWQ